MSERTQYPFGVPCWIDLAAPDPEAALEFYGPLLGWDFVGPGPMPDDQAGRYFVARVRGKDVAGVFSVPPGLDAPPAWSTHVAVESVDETTDVARGAGATVLAEPFDALPAGRMSVLADPAGAVFCLWQAGERQGAQLVNEPSAWAMSALRTADTDRAAAFYNAVFGWESEAFAPGVALFRRPGYVGGEPLQPVPRDVVAAMMQVDGPAAWGVDVWVADAQSTARQAAALGGRVLDGPREIPGFLNAVIADPQGAVLSISELIAGSKG
jgi:predicted enzyme related to lactoylglutathione lyase